MLHTSFEDYRNFRTMKSCLLFGRPPRRLLRSDSVGRLIPPRNTLVFRRAANSVVGRCGVDDCGAGHRRLLFTIVVFVVKYSGSSAIINARFVLLRRGASRKEFRCRASTIVVYCWAAVYRRLRRRASTFVAGHLGSNRSLLFNIALFVVRTLARRRSPTRGFL